MNATRMSAAVAQRYDELLEELLDAGKLEPVGEIMLRISGKRPHPSTVWRWNRRPGRGGPIPARMLFGALHSTESAVRSWLALKSEYVPRQAPASAGPTDAELRQRGLLT